MIRSLLFFILICSFTSTMAQYEPQFSQNMFNLATVNPGFAGSSGKVCVSALNRQQWLGMEGAPKTTVFCADAGVRFLGYEHGVGLNFMRDEIGAFVNIRYSFLYSYKIDIAEGQLGAGLLVGLVSQTLKGGELYTDPSRNIKGNKRQLGSNDYHIASDPLVPSSDVSGVDFDLGWGVFYKEKRYYAGFSGLHLNQPKPDLNGFSDFKVRRTWFLTGGYVFDFPNKSLEIEPSFFYKTDEVIHQIDVTTLFKYKKRYWGGVGYRLQDAIIVLAGMELKNGLKVGYSYDFTVSQLAGFQTHEVMLAYWFSVGVSKKSKQFRSVRYL